MIIRTFTVLFFLTNFFCLHSQDQQKKGFLVFESHKFIGNTHLKPSESEIEKEKERLRQFVKNEIDSETPDEFINSIPKSELEFYNGSMKCLHTLDIYEYYFESKTSCDYLKKSNIERFQQINRSSLEANTVERNTLTNHYNILPKRQIKLQSIPSDYRIIEKRNETKVIAGYKCFKVILKKGLQTNPHLTIYDIEMYVTEDINLNFSPICNYKEILNKYYPLEITRKPREEIMTEITTWKIKSIDLKNE